MPLQHAVLALLTEGPSYGYELKATFQEAIGPQWGELNIGHLYQILDRLVRDGLVTGEVVPQADRPNKTVYRLTDGGRDELDEWLSRPFTRQAGYRDDFFLKLFAAARLGVDELRGVVRRQQVSHLAELRALTALREGHRDDPLVGLLIEAAVLHTQANLRVVEAAGERAEEIAAAAPFTAMRRDEEGSQRRRQA